jgi:hypothetical protein
MRDPANWKVQMSFLPILVEDQIRSSSRFCSNSNPRSFPAKLGQRLTRKLKKLVFGVTLGQWVGDLQSTTQSYLGSDTLYGGPSSLPDSS